MNHFLFTSGMISIHHTHKDYGIKQGLEVCNSRQIMLMETLCRDVLRYIERHQVQACHFTLIATSTSSPVVKFNARSAQRFTQSELNARHLVFRFHLSYSQDHFKRPNQVLYGEILNINAWENEFFEREEDVEVDPSS